jgi:hypothetical protein
MTGDVFYAKRDDSSDNEICENTRGDAGSKLSIYKANRY